MKRFAAWIVILTCTLGTIGCGGSSSGEGNTHDVAKISGEDDSQVTPQLNALVGQAYTRSETDEPLEGF